MAHSVQRAKVACRSNKPTSILFYFLRENTVMDKVLGRYEKITQLYIFGTLMEHGKAQSRKPVFPFVLIIFSPVSRMKLSSSGTMGKWRINQVSRIIPGQRTVSH
jgi:hypothetical protein